MRDDNVPPFRAIMITRDQPTTSLSREARALGPRTRDAKGSGGDKQCCVCSLNLLQVSR